MIDDKQIIEEERLKRHCEKEVRNFLHQQIIADCGDAWDDDDDPEDWICEWNWHRGVLYVSTDALKDPYAIASLKKGLFNF